MGRRSRKKARSTKSIAEISEPVKQSPSLPVIKFVLSFLVSLAVCGGAYAWVTAEYHEYMNWMMTGTAGITSIISRAVATDVYWEGKIVAVDGFSVEIIDECTGLLEMVIYLAAIIAFSTTLKKKGIGLLIGIPVIYLFNLMRIVVLLLVGSRSQSLFEFMHLYFWQVTLIVMIASVWIGWLYLVVYREKKPVAVPA